MKELFGNEEIKSELLLSVANGTVGHAYIFCGISGIGKFLFAKDFAKSIMCLNSSDGLPCGTCEHCVKIDASPDLFIIEPEEGLIKIEKIRALISEAQLKPTLSNKKVFIIKDADLMNTMAQNALLKVLEEPPQYVTIILTVQNLNRILNTITSRCTIINFKPLSYEEMTEIFPGEKITKELYDFSAGSAGRMSELLDDSRGELLEEFEKAIKENDLIKMNEMLSAIKAQKDIKDTIDDAFDLLESKLRANIKDNPILIANQIEIIEETKRNLARYANFDTSLDYMMIRLWQLNKR